MSENIRDRIATLIQAGKDKSSYETAGEVCKLLGEPVECLERTCVEAEGMLRRAGWEHESLQAFLERMGGLPAGVSPSGLLRFTQPKLGLVVSAAEHEHVVAKLSKDKERLDWLDQRGTLDLNWVARESSTGRGYRLHQTHQLGHATTREAIDFAQTVFSAQLPFSEANPPR